MTEVIVFAAFSSMAAFSNAADSKLFLIPEVGPLGENGVVDMGFKQDVQRLTKHLDRQANVQCLVSGGEKLSAFSIGYRPEWEFAEITFVIIDKPSDVAVKKLKISKRNYFRIEKLWIEQLKAVRHSGFFDISPRDRLVYHLYSYFEGRQLAGYFPSGDYKDTSINLWKIDIVQDLVFQASVDDRDADRAKEWLEKEIEVVFDKEN